MPRVADFDGIHIYMYAEDHNPPHVHAFHGDDEALLVIATGAVMAGHLPSRQLRAARDWIVANRAKLMDRWAELSEV